MFVSRSVQRIGKPLVVGAATRDERFARDPYLADVECRSVLALPIPSRGALHAVLLLETAHPRRVHCPTTRRCQTHRRATRRHPRQCPAHHLPRADRSRRSRPPAHRTRSARRRPATAGLIYPATAHRPGRVPPGPASWRRAGRAGRRGDGALDELAKPREASAQRSRVEGGLRPAFNTLARRPAIPFDIQTCADGPLPEPVEISAYYALAEALTNAAKQTQASTVIVANAANAVLYVAVHDDGRDGADFTRGPRLSASRTASRHLGRPNPPRRPARSRHQPARRAPTHPGQR